MHNKVINNIFIGFGLSLLILGFLRVKLLLTNYYGSQALILLFIIIALSFLIWSIIIVFKGSRLSRLDRFTPLITILVSLIAYNVLPLNAWYAQVENHYISKQRNEAAQWAVNQSVSNDKAAHFLDLPSQYQNLSGSKSIRVINNNGQYLIEFFYYGMLDNYTAVYYVSDNNVDIIKEYFGIIVSKTKLEDHWYFVVLS